MSPFEGRRGIRRAFRLSTPRRAREDVDAELRFHLDGYADDLVRQGYPREQAEAEARRRFGDVTRIREECTMIDTQGRRRRDRGEQLATLVREARQSLRALVRARSFSAIAIITLALGIGAATAIFTLLDSVVLRPLPYVAPDRLVFLSSPVPGYKPGAEWGLSQAGYFFFRKENRSFDDIGVYAAPMLTLARDGHAERVQGAVVTASLLHVLRVGPALGRAITPEDDRPNVAPVAMLGYDFWRTRFGGDPRVIGQVIDLEGQRIQVVGVMRRGAGLPDVRVDVWLPEQLDPLRTPVNSHMNFAGAIARLKPGVTLEAANADLARLTARLPDVFPTVYTPSFMSSTRFATRAVSLRDHVVGSTARVLWILLAAVGLVLVIACANVANLFLVRAESRRREVAVRTALGADRWRIASHYVTESVLLALVAGALAVALAYGGIRLFLAIAPSELPRLAEVRVTWGAVGVALVFSLAAGVLFGLFPLLRGGRATVDVITLRQGRGLSGSRGQHAIRGALVVAQVALALVLLAGAGLLLRSYDRLRQVQPGFDPHGVVAVDVALPYVRYRDYEAVKAFYQRFIERLGEVPGVVAAGATTDLPLDAPEGCSSIALEHVPRPPGGEPDCVPVRLVTPGYFQAMGIRVEGRAPSWSDVEHRGGEVVVTRALARRLWPGENPMGKGLKGNGGDPPFYHVVGVTGDVRELGLDKPPVEAVYFPMLPMPGTYLWSPPRFMSVVVRAPGVSEQQLGNVIRRALAEVDPLVPVAKYRSMDAVVRQSMVRVSLTMMLLGIAAAMALVLSAVGLYGVISYVVGERRSEIGIRMALGASGPNVRRMVMMQSARLAAAGVLIGVAGALATTRVLRSLLFEVSAGDPITLGAAGLLLVAIAAVASWFPARRAARVDPMEVLRAE